MAWVKFTRDFTYTHPALLTVSTAYKAGMVQQVVTSCAEAAIAAGAAQRTERPKADNGENDERGGPGTAADVPETDSAN
jgi:hypothetical protein